MSNEIGGSKPDASKADWAKGPGNYTVTEVNPGKRQSGWAFEDIPPHDEFNWIQQHIGDLLTWQAANAERVFPTLHDALWEGETAGEFALADGETFRCFESAQPAQTEIVIDEQGSRGAVAVERACTDGKRIFYYQAGYVVAIDPRDPTNPLWETAIVNASSFQGMCCDGGIVFVTVGGITSIQQELRAFDAETGAIPSGWSSIGLSLPYGVGGGVASNGLHVAAIARNLAASPTQGAVEVVEARNSVSGSDTYDHGGGLFDCAIDFENTYICGSAGTGGFHARALRTSISALTQRWAFTVPATVGTPHLYAICADSERVYMAGANVTDGAVQSNVWCVSRFDGSLLWRALTGSGIEALSVVADERWLYVTDEDDLKILDKATGAILFFDGAISYTAFKFATDCDSMLFVNGTGNNIRAVRVGRNAARRFVKVSDTDENRRPFYKLVAPVF